MHVRINNNRPSAIVARKVGKKKLRGLEIMKLLLYKYCISTKYLEYLKVVFVLK